MTRTAFDLGLSLRARRAGRAIPRLTHRSRALHTDARVLAVAAMPGETDALWGVGIAPVGHRICHYTVADPRHAPTQLPLWQWITGSLRPWANRADPHPQLVVADTGTIDLLAAAADRFRHNADPAVADGAQLIAWACDRHTSAGQDTILAATGLADEHWAWGTQPLTLHDRVAWLTDSPPVPETVVDPADSADMAAKVRRHVAAVDSGASPALLALHTRAITTLLAPQLVDQATAINQVLSHLNARTPTAGAAETCADETRRWQHALSRRHGPHIALRDSPVAAARRLADQETVAAAWETALIWDDPLEWERAKADGTVITGTLTSIGPGAGRLVTPQPVIRTRPGAPLTDHARRFVATVTRTSSDGIDLALPDTPDGHVELGPEPPNWTQVTLTRINTARRLAQPAWTHQHQAKHRRSASRTAPGGRLTTVDALRAPPPRPPRPR